MKFLNHIFPAFVLLTLAACSEELPMPQRSVDQSANTITVGVSLNIGEMPGAKSRAFTDQPNYSDLKLYVIEFNLKGTPMQNTFSRNYTDSISNYGVNTEDGDIHFNITLDKKDEPCVLNFIAVPKSVDFDFESGNGLEGSIIPGLTLDDSTPAYWQRIEFPDGYGSLDDKEQWTDNPDLKTTLDHVPMIRNFAKISLAVSNGAGFILDGFALLNRPTKGTVAPWIATSTPMRFPDFLNDDEAMKSYDDINAAYKGYSPFSDVTDVWETKPADATYDTDPKYLYERPHSSINNPVVIMRGRKTATGPLMYYKLDLGRKDDDNHLFEFFNIIRNFEYAITVTKVGADGYATAQEAMDGVVFNNFSFDINTRQMLNVSNGEDMLWVNNTTFVVTEDSETTIHFLYRYRKGIATNGGTLSNGVLQFKDLETGEAITGIVYGTTDNADGWREVTITTKDPSSTRLSQDFIIYDPTTGLGRTIRIIVRNPWNYTAPSLYGVNYDTYAQYEMAVADHSDWNGYVSNVSVGQPLTVGFRIDDEIPEAMFPLEFIFEANPQDIENNKVGNLVVKTEPTYFSEAANRPTTIKYVKTVTWADYNTDLSEAYPTGTKVKAANGSEYHFVRARFQTIAVPTGQTTVRVYNPYIRVQGSASKYLDLTFSPKADPAPDLMN